MKQAERKTAVNTLKYTILLLLGWLASYLLAAILTEVGVFVLVALVGVLAALTVFLQPVFGAYLLALSIPLEAVLMPHQDISWAKLVGLGVGSAWFLRKLVRRGSFDSILESHMLWAACVFVLFVISSLLWVQSYVPPLLTILQFPQLLVLAIVVYDLLENWRQVERLVQFLLAGGLICSILTLYQAFGEGVRRAGGDVTGGINTTAAMIVEILPFAFCLMRSSSGHWVRWLAWAYFIVAPVAVSVTFSRTNYLMLLVVFVFCAWRLVSEGEGGRLFLTLATLTLVTLLAVPWSAVATRGASVATLLGITQEIEPADSGRFFHWAVAVEIFKDHPVLGAGYQNFGHLAWTRYQMVVPGAPGRFGSARSPHSSILGLLSDLGLVGLALWMWLQIAAFRNLLSAKPDREPNNLRAREIRWAVMVSLTILFLNSFVTDNFDHKILWLILALTQTVRRLLQAAPILAALRQNPQLQTVTASF